MYRVLKVRSNFSKVFRALHTVPCLLKIEIAHAIVQTLVQRGCEIVRNFYSEAKICMYDAYMTFQGSIQLSAEALRRKVAHIKKNQFSLPETGAQ